MNDKDIQLFAKTFVYGTNKVVTEQTSREPIELKDTKSHNGDGLFERFNMVECSLEEIESDLVEKLKLFIETVQVVRESDAKFSKAQIAEEKRQAKVAKKLKQTLNK